MFTSKTSAVLLSLATAMGVQAVPGRPISARSGFTATAKTSFSTDGPGAPHDGSGSVSYYALGTGKCGWDMGSVVSSDYVVAIEGTPGQGTPLAEDTDGEAFVNIGLDCGTCLEVTAEGGTGTPIYVTIADERNRGEAGLDISEAAFIALFGSTTQGMGQVTWAKADQSKCKTTWSGGCASGLNGGNYCH